MYQPNQYHNNGPHPGSWGAGPNGVGPQPARKKNSAALLIGLSTIAVLLGVIVIGGAFYIFGRNDSAQPNAASETNSAASNGDGDSSPSQAHNAEPSEDTLRSDAPNAVRAIGQLLADSEDDPEAYSDYVCSEDVATDGFKDFVEDMSQDMGRSDSLDLEIDDARVYDEVGEISGAYIVTMDGDTWDQDAEEFISVFRFEDEAWKLCATAEVDLPGSGGSSPDDSGGYDNQDGTRPV